MPHYLLTFLDKGLRVLEVKCLVLGYIVASGRAYVVTQHFWKQVIFIMVRGKHVDQEWTELLSATGWLVLHIK